MAAQKKPKSKSRLAPAADEPVAPAAPNSLSSDNNLPADSFLRFAELCEQLAATRSKLAKRALLAGYLQSLDDAAASLAAHYLTGSPFAESDRRTLQVGGSLLSRVLAEVSHASDTAMTAAYRRHGDLGAAAFDLLTAAKHEPAPALPLADLSRAFDQLAANVKRAVRQQIVLEILRAATPLEAKYILKIMLGDIRTGVQQSLVEEAIAAASDVPLAAVRRAVLHTGDLGEALRAARAGALDGVLPKLFHPLGFMLASPVESPEEAFARMDPAAKKIPSESEEAAGDVEEVVVRAPFALHVEDKFDGMRAQVHCEQGRVAIYSRNREDITASFQELAAAFSIFPGRAILDGEVLGWEHATGRALPFATFSMRLGRKLVSKELLQSTPVAFLAFDCLFAGDSMLLDEPLAARREALVRVIEEARTQPLPAAVATEAPQATLFIRVDEPAPLAAPILLSPVALPTTVEQLEAAFLAARERSNEGLMIKNPKSLYTPGRRGYAWLKLKRELATLDVVITGAEFGHGRRAGILSDYSFAVRGPDGELLNVGKAYSGLTDVEIATLSAWCMQHTAEDYGHFRTVEPEILLEVAFNNVMRSERHNSGFALRFPRIVRLRPDKPLAEIDTLERVEEIYQSQPDKPVNS